MKITIDTKEESKEEIKKLISFLQKLIDEDSYSSYSSESPEPTAGAFNMFSDNSQDTSSSSSGYTNIFGENKPEEQTLNTNEDVNLHMKKEDEPFNMKDMLEQY
ncbi:MAG: hypothetical protein KAH32_08700, partial [Chlamydiia bacterium]|nr:hypothetical protein [Chlamydiia bacterium]